MFKRLIAILALTAVPTFAFADDAPAADPSAPTTTETPAPDATPAPATGGASAAQLGPASGSNSGASSADSGALQPAGQSPLQSTTGDATGLTAPNGNVLQAPASGSDQLKVLQGEADGSPTSVADGSGPSPWGWLGFSLLFAIIIALARLWLPRRWLQRLRPRPKKS